MTFSYLAFEFVGPALLFGVLVAVFTRMFLVLFSIRLSASMVFLMASVLFFVALTQHPFPSRSDLSCPVASASPQLSIFNFRHTIFSLAERNIPVHLWLGNKTILATLMNVVVCMFIGAALAFRSITISGALLIGLALSFSIELTQLTGVWGIFPCAYRQFNVDDILFNVLGVGLGFYFARKFFVGACSR